MNGFEAILHPKCSVTGRKTYVFFQKQQFSYPCLEKCKEYFSQKWTKKSYAIFAKDVLHTSFPQTNYYSFLWTFFIQHFRRQYIDNVESFFLSWSTPVDTVPPYVQFSQFLWGKIFICTELPVPWNERYVGKSPDELQKLAEF